VTIILECGTVENCNNISDEIEKTLGRHIDISKMPEGEDIVLIVDSLRRNLEVSFPKAYFYRVYSAIKDIELDGFKFE